MAPSLESTKGAVFAPRKLTRAADQGSSFLAFLGANLPAHHLGRGVRWPSHTLGPCLPAGPCAACPPSRPSFCPQTTCSSQIRLCSVGMLSTADVQAQMVNTI